MKIVWLGHSGFRIETGTAVLLIDPWLTGNPLFPADRRDEAIAGATHVLVTHGHHDHVADVLAIAGATGAEIVCSYELAAIWSRAGATCVGVNRGGTVDAGDARVTAVPASHSSSLNGPDGPIYAGPELGFVIAAEGRVVYVSGDTAITADMDWIGAYFRPDIGILSAGGRFTMDMAAAAWAAKRYFDFRQVIPCHFRTTPALEQSIDALVAGLPGVRVTEPVVLESVPLD